MIHLHVHVYCLSMKEITYLHVLSVGYLMLRMCEQHLVVKSVDMYYQSCVSHDRRAEGKLLSQYAKIYMFLPLFAVTSCFWTLYLDCSTWDQQDLICCMLLLVVHIPNIDMAVLLFFIYLQCCLYTLLCIHG